MPNVRRPDRSRQVAGKYHQRSNSRGDCDSDHEVSVTRLETPSEVRFRWFTPKIRPITNLEEAVNLFGWGSLGAHVAAAIIRGRPVRVVSESIKIAHELED